MARRGLSRALDGVWNSIGRPSPFICFIFAVVLFFLVTSGVVYDMVVEPPYIGTIRDPNSGRKMPVTFVPGRVNAQYIIEGLTSGVFFCLGGLGLIFVDRALSSPILSKDKLLVGGIGVGLVSISYVILTYFLRTKVRRYMI
mmetsp:Transcript_16311/g.24581  ORF Transcript_16311/g.24581 Transcript_16311/m.24581 type:complete len:142 (-) Transcript_16311:147-572(-)